MGRGRSTLALFLALVALGAYIYFVERKREPASEAGEKKEKVFAALDAARIEELRLTGSGGTTSVLQKKDGRWSLVEPLAAAADEGEVSSLTTNLSSLESQRVVDEQPKSLADYGLAAPKVQVAFRAAGDKNLRTLRLGEKTPTGGDMYAQVDGSPRVFLVSGFLHATFDKKPFDLRDKAALKIDREKVDGIEVQGPSGTIRFTKALDGWRIAAPIEARADAGTVEGLLSRISGAQMRAVVTEQAPDDLGPYGLDEPAYTVTLASGSARSVFQTGTKNAEGQIHARDASRPVVFTVDGFVVDDLAKGVSEYRPKDLFEFRTFTGNRLEVTRDGATVAFEKQKLKKEGDPERWAQVQPAATIEDTKIVDALSKVTDLRAESFADLPAGAALVATVRAKFSDGKKEETVSFHKAGEDVFATRPGEPGAAKVAAADFTAAMGALDALESAAPPAKP
jgi:hypothetical protein